MTLACTDLNIIDLGKTHSKFTLLRIKIFVDDENRPREEIDLVRHNSTHKIPGLINL